jgi:hypothetical protein
MKRKTYVLHVRFELETKTGLICKPGPDLTYRLTFKAINDTQAIEKVDGAIRAFMRRNPVIFQLTDYQIDDWNWSAEAFDLRHRLKALANQKKEGRIWRLLSIAVF